MNPNPKIPTKALPRNRRSRGRQSAHSSALRPVSADSRRRLRFKGSKRELRFPGILPLALRDLLHAWKPVVGYLAWFTLLNLAVLTPLSAWLLETIVNSTGEVAVSNAALAEFALSARGALFLMATVTFYLAVLQIELGGLTLIAAQSARRQPFSLWNTIRQSLTRIPAFLRLSLIQAGTLLFLLSVATGLLALIKNTLLGGHDINFYLTETPPAWWKAVTLAGLVSLLFGALSLWITIRWLAALPILLLGGQGCRASLGASWQTTQGRVLRIAALLLAWWLGTGALWALLSWIAHWLANPLYNWAGLIPTRVIPLVATSAAITGGMAMLWGIVTLGVHQFAVTRLTIELRGLPLPTAGQSSNEPKSTVSTRRFIRIAWLTALLLALASALTGWAMVRDLDLVDSVQITAHRGSSAKAPENTLAAFRQAIKDGADSIELDVQTCADGSVVVIHDRDLMRVGGDPRRVEDLTLDEVQRIDVGIRFGKDFAGEHVPTLEEVIDVVQGRAKLNIELKYNRPDPSLVPAVVKLVEQKDFLEHCVITSLDVAAIREFKMAKPKAVTGLIVTAAVGRVARTEADFLSIAAHRATASAIRSAHREGKAVHVWTVNDPLAMLQMIESGADNIITDKPDVLRRVLEERAMLSDPEKLAIRLRVLFGGGIPIHPTGSSQQ